MKECKVPGGIRAHGGEGRVKSTATDAPNYRQCNFTNIHFLTAEHLPNMKSWNLYNNVFLSKCLKVFFSVIIKTFSDFCANTMSKKQSNLFVGRSKKNISKAKIEDRNGIHVPKLEWRVLNKKSVDLSYHDFFFIILYILVFFFTSICYSVTSLQFF